MPTENEKLLNLHKMMDGGFCFLGKDASSRRICELLPVIASSDATVLIEGESGTGKELIATAIHMLSSRNSCPFVTVNCAAIPETLLEAELFGFEKGSFTGALNLKKGYFEQADRGTLFLDEIGDLSMHSQAKILRALQEKEIQRIGGEKKLQTDVRVISATNQNLIQKISQRTFREDLFFRLNIVPLKIPPLRERLSDLPRIAALVLENLCSRRSVSTPEITVKAFDKMLDYHWPGNIRELQNVMERALVFCRSGKICETDIILTEFSTQNCMMDNAVVPLKQMEKEMIQRALKKYSSKSDAARVLDIPLRTLYSRIRALDIDTQHK